MGTPDISLFLAFSAGALSFASPCVLPLVPAYLGYLGGQAMAGEGTPPRWTTFLHGLFFVAGFSAIFVALGAAASGIGQLLYTYRQVLTKIGGVVIAIFGLHTLGLIKIPFLYYDTRHHYQPKPGPGCVSSALMGFFFGAGWSPCIGATLGAILTLALSEATVGHGALLLLVYSMGLGIPFLLIALGIDRAASLLRRARRAMRVVTIVSGVFLLVVSLLVFTDNLALLTQWLFPADVNDTTNANAIPTTETTPTAKATSIAATPPRIGSAAPAFALDTLDGETVTLPELRGQVVIVNLWATWCIPCREEMPALESVWNDYRERGLVVLAVNQGESANRVRSFVDEQNWTLPVLLDPNETLRDLYQPRGYPTTYFIDQEGNLREIVFGGTLDEATTIIAKITPLLMEATGK